MGKHEIEKLKAEVAKAQGQRDLADQARREAVARAHELGQQNDDLRAQIAEITDARAENEQLKTQNAELAKQAKATTAANKAAEALFAAHRDREDANKRIAKLL